MSSDQTYAVGVHAKEQAVVPRHCAETTVDLKMNLTVKTWVREAKEVRRDPLASWTPLSFAA